MVQKTKQNKIKIRLAKPFLGNRNDFNGILKEILDCGFLTQGRYVEQFENLVARYLDVPNAIAVSSGTAALHLVLLALDIGLGDEVIVPAFTFPATANVVELVGAKPVFVDVDLSTYNIDEKMIKKAITCRTSAIIPVHLFGNPANMEAIINIAKSKGLKVIEDSAGALGSVYKGRKCGTIGDVGCFSFHPRKIITTAEGGMVITNNYKIVDKIRLLRNHGMKYSNSKVDFVSPGFNYRMNELEAVLGLIQMKEINSLVTERKKLFSLYKKYLSGDSSCNFQEVLTGCQQAIQTFVIRNKKVRSQRLLGLLRKRGIEVTIGTYAMHILRYYKEKYGYKPNDYPNAYKLYLQGLALPFYNGMKVKDIKQVCSQIRKSQLKKCSN